MGKHPKQEAKERKEEEREEKKERKRRRKQRKLWKLELIYPPPRAKTLLIILFSEERPVVIFFCAKCVVCFIRSQYVMGKFVIIKFGLTLSNILDIIKYFRHYQIYNSSLKK